MALLNTPQAQQAITIPVTPNMDLELGFDPGSETQLSREGDNLIFTFENGGQIILTDFYAQAPEDLPTMEIQGAQIEAQDFLASLGDETLLPAAGPTAPQAAATDSSGSGAYNDGSGSLIDGVDYLGTLGRDFWGGTTRPPLTDEGVLVAEAAAAPPGPGPGPDPDPDPDPENFTPSITGAPKDLTVHEDGLPDGTKADVPGHLPIAKGSLAITSGDDLATIKIGGLIITITGIGPDGKVEFSVSGDSTVPYGDFTVSNITKGGDVYTVNYQYELKEAPLTHTEKNVDHESLPDKINIPVEAIDKDGDSTGEQSFTLDILDDNPETNSDWVTIDPESRETIYGNLNDGMWGTAKGEYTNSAADSEGNSAADNWGADGGRVTKITDSEGKEYDVPKDGYVDVPTDSGTLRVYPNGDYEFTPKPGFADKTLIDFDNAVHAKYDSKHSVELEGYTLEAMLYDPATGEFTNADFHITDNVDRQIGIKHGDTVSDEGHKNEISTYTDKEGKTVSEGVLITMPADSTATSMSFSLTNFRDNVEQANWIIVYADGTVVKGSSALSEFTLDFLSEHGPVESVFIYANDDDETSFFIDKMAMHEAEEVPFKDVTFDYEVTDGDGDTSTSQLHIKGDETEPMTKAAAMDPTAAGGLDDDQRHLLDDDTSGGIMRGAAHADKQSDGDDANAHGKGDDGAVADGKGDGDGGGLGEIIRGSDGDDIFIWTAGDKAPSGSPVIDTIKDFSMNNLAGKGNDQIDLRDLLGEATENTLDNYLSITRVGDHAELHIYADGNPNGTASQVIVLEDVYATHGSGDNSADVNELIKQHVILNS